MEQLQQTKPASFSPFTLSPSSTFVTTSLRPVLDDAQVHSKSAFTGWRPIPICCLDSINIRPSIF